MRAGDKPETRKLEIITVSAFYAVEPQPVVPLIDGSNNAVQPGFDTEAFGNQNAKWETTTQTNLGIDATFLKGMFSFENLDLYNRTTSDMLCRCIACYSGVPLLRFLM